MPAEQHRRERLRLQAAGRAAPGPGAGPGRWCGCAARAAGGSASPGWRATGPGTAPHLFYKLLAYRRRKGEPKGFTWADYRDLIIATHRGLSAPPA